VLLLRSASGALDYGKSQKKEPCKLRSAARLVLCLKYPSYEPMLAYDF